MVLLRDDVNSSTSVDGKCHRSLQCVTVVVETQLCGSSSVYAESKTGFVDFPDNKSGSIMHKTGQSTVFPHTHCSH